MLSERELRIRRLAYELWERAGQRGLFSDYMDFVAAEFDRDSEDEAEPAMQTRGLPSF
jgi:Protein of unknown function (DUF2934)